MTPYHHCLNIPQETWDISVHLHFIIFVLVCRFWWHPFFQLRLSWFKSVNMQENCEIFSLRVLSHSVFSYKHNKLTNSTCSLVNALLLLLSPQSVAPGHLRLKPHLLNRHEDYKLIVCEHTQPCWIWTVALTKPQDTHTHTHTHTYMHAQMYRLILVFLGSGWLCTKTSIFFQLVIYRVVVWWGPYQGLSLETSRWTDSGIRDLSFRAALIFSVLFVF